MRVTYNGSAISTGTKYLRDDGTLTTDANDGRTWIRRGPGPVCIQGLLVGGSHTVSLEWSNEFDPREVLATSAVTDLTAGEEHDEHAVSVRLKLVQASSSTTSQLLVLTV